MTHSQPKTLIAVIFSLLPALGWCETPIAAPVGFQIATVEEPPTNFTDETGQIAGLSVDVVRAMQSQVGDTTSIRVFPAARLVKMMQNTPNLLMFSLARTPEREKLGLHWIMQTTVKPWAFYTLANSPVVINHLDDARGLKNIGVVTRDVRETYLEAHGFTNVEPVTEHVINLNKLLAGRVAVILDSRWGVASTCKMMEECSMARFKFLYSPHYSNSWIAMSPNSDPAIVARWQQAADLIRQDGSYNKLALIWQRYLKNEYEIETSFNQDGILVLGLPPKSQHAEQVGQTRQAEEPAL